MSKITLKTTVFEGDVTITYLLDRKVVLGSYNIKNRTFTSVHKYPEHAEMPIPNQVIIKKDLPAPSQRNVYEIHRANLLAHKESYKEKTADWLRKRYPYLDIR